MVKKIFIYNLIAVIFVTLIIYFMLPFHLLKGILIAKAQENLHHINSGLELQVGSISGYWLTGFECSHLIILDKNNPQDGINVEKFRTRLSILPLLIGKANISTYIKLKQGEATFFISLSLLKILSQTIEVKGFNAYFSDFKLDQIIKQGFALLRNINNPSLSLIKPLIANTSAGGLLVGIIDYKNSENYISKLALVIKNGYFNIENSSLNIPKQILSTAQIDLEYKRPMLKINKFTNLTTQNISVTSTGSINLEKSEQPLLNINLNVFLSGEVEKNFGFLLPQLINCPASTFVGNTMHVTLTGPVSNFSCQSF